MRGRALRRRIRQVIFDARGVPHMLVDASRGGVS